MYSQPENEELRNAKCFLTNRQENDENCLVTDNDLELIFGQYECGNGSGEIRNQFGGTGYVKWKTKRVGIF